MKYTDIITLADFKRYCIEQAADQELVQKQMTSAEATLVALVRGRYLNNQDVDRWPQGCLAHFTAPDKHKNVWYCVLIYYEFPDGYRIGLYSLSTDPTREMVEKVLIAPHDMLKDLTPE
jgi:hypothetical protein